MAIDESVTVRRLNTIRCDAVSSSSGAFSPAGRYTNEPVGLAIKSVPCRQIHWARRNSQRSVSPIVAVPKRKRSFGQLSFLRQTLHADVRAPSQRRRSSSVKTELVRHSASSATFREGTRRPFRGPPKIVQRITHDELVVRISYT